MTYLLKQYYVIEDFVSLINLLKTAINPLTAGAAYIRVFIFY